MAALWAALGLDVEGAGLVARQDIDVGDLRQSRDQ